MKDKDDRPSLLTRRGQGVEERKEEDKDDIWDILQLIIVVAFFIMVAVVTINLE